MIWTASAIHSLPVALLELVVALFLAVTARKARASSSNDLGQTRQTTTTTTALLAAWFFALVGLNGFHVLACTVTTPRISFWLNHVGESVSALCSTVPLLAFAYLLGDDGAVGPSARKPPSAGGFQTNLKAGWWRAERAFCVGAAALIASALSVGFVLHTLSIDDSALYYRLRVEHVEASSTSPLWGQSLALFVLCAYAQATLVLLRRAARLSPGRARQTLLAFAGVTASAVVAVVINRVEDTGALPTGSYVAWTLLSILAAVVVYMGHSDELASFSERIVGITLALVLLAGAAASELAVRLRGDQEDAVRQVLVERARRLWDDGERKAARAIADATVLDGSRAKESAVSEHPPSIDETVLYEQFTSKDGTTVRLSFPYVEKARAVDGIARAVAFSMVLATLLCVLVLRYLFEHAVLAPLRLLERASASSRAKTLFIAQLSHELRTPLSAVVGHAESLASTLKDRDDRARATNIKDAGFHLLALVEGLIEEGKTDLAPVVARYEPTTVRAAVAAALDLARPRAAAAVRLATDIAEDVPERIDTDPRVLRQILLNLLVNAAKHTSEGSITVRVRKQDDSLTFAVVDTGVGIPEDQHEKIFLAFHQVKEGEGAGLGLAIVRRLSDALSARIAVDSVPGRGATFTLTLPCPPSATRARRHTTAKAKEARGEGAAEAEGAGAAGAEGAEGAERAGAERRDRPHTRDGRQEHDARGRSRGALLGETLVLPDGALWEELRSLALDGDVVALDERARALASLNDALVPFADRVHTLAAAYEVRALQALFEPRAANEAEKPEPGA